MNSTLHFEFQPAEAYDLLSTFSLDAMGQGDRCLRIDSTGTVKLVVARGDEISVVELQQERGDDQASVRVTLTGPNPGWLQPRLPDFLGLNFQPPTLEGPRRLRHLAHRFAGMRLPRWPVLFPRLVQLVLQQLVSYRDACLGWQDLVRRYGRPIPGFDQLSAPPTAKALAQLASYQFVECGILPQHGRRIVGLAKIASKIESVWDGGRSPEADDKLLRLLNLQRGVGPWTIGSLQGAAMGDADAIVLGDYGFPKHVAYFFEGGEEAYDANDDDMLRLLAPYRPYRYYVLSLITRGAPTPPRRGPRHRLLRDRLRSRR